MAGDYIGRLPDVSPDEQAVLFPHGMKRVAKFLNLASTHEGRVALSERLKIPRQRILDHANSADLLRVKGLGTDYIRLLRACRVRTLKQLRAKNPIAFHKKLLAYNKVHGIVTFPPSLYHVTLWIESAKSLELKISYQTFP